MVDMDSVNPNNKIELLNASIKNMEEMLDEVKYGLDLARARQITFVKTGDINTSEYEATKELIDELEKEFDDYKRKLSALRKERAELS
jgi:cob(I)alamin adenosyltransferase